LNITVGDSNATEQQNPSAQEEKGKHPLNSFTLVLIVLAAVVLCFVLACVVVAVYYIKEWKSRESSFTRKVAHELETNTNTTQNSKPGGTELQNTSRIKSNVR